MTTDSIITSDVNNKLTFSSTDIVDTLPDHASDNIARNAILFGYAIGKFSADDALAALLDRDLLSGDAKSVMDMLVAGQRALQNGGRV